MKQILWLRQYLAKYRYPIAFGILALICVDVCQLAIPYAIKRAIDSLTMGTATGRSLFLNGLFLLLIVTGIWIFRFGWRYYIIGSAHRTERDLRDRFYDHVIRLPLIFFQKKRIGDFMAISSNDIVAVRHALGEGILICADMIIMSIGAFYCMTRINVELTLYAFMPAPFIIVLFVTLGPVIHRLFRNVQDSFGRLTACVEETISGNRVVKAYVQEKGENAKFRVFNEDYRDKNMRLVRTDALFHSFMFFLPSLSYFLVLLVGGSKAIRGEISVGDFVAANMYVWQLVWPMIAIGWIFNLFQRAGASIKRIREVLEQPDEFEGDGPSVHLDVPIEIRNLNFIYPGSETAALRNFTLTLRRGETVALMGRTGSGKSTLVNILTRLYDPPRGTVFIGGRDVLDIPKKELRLFFGVAPQEAFLFTDTIKKNISFGISDAEDDQIVRVAKSAQIYNDIVNLPQNFDTLVGERGVTLSGGQRQRASLARAILTRRKVIVLDDSFSAVDVLTEKRILESLKKEKEGRTVLVITHRVNVAQMADRIVVMEKGAVADQGTEEELLSREGFYKEVFEHQQTA